MLNDSPLLITHSVMFFGLSNIGRPKETHILVEKFLGISGQYTSIHGKQKKLILSKIHFPLNQCVESQLLKPSCTSLGPLVIQAHN